MFKNSIYRSSVILSVALLPFAAQSAPILSEVAIVTTTGDSGDVPASSTEGATSFIGGTVSVGNQFFGNYAIQQSNGESDVRAISTEGGGFDFELVTSSATFTQAETNTTNATRQYFLNYTVQNLEADLDHWTDGLDDEPGFIVARSAQLPSAGTPLTAVNPFGPTDADINASSVTAASFEYFISVNGQDVLRTRADGMVSFGGGEVTEGLGAFGDSAEITGSFLNGFEFSVDGISGEIDLGTFDSGEEVTVVSGLIARAYSHGGSVFQFGGFEDECGIDFIEECGFRANNGAFSLFNDPVIVSSIGSRVVDPSPVPLPAAGWMLIAGLGGLAAMRRRKKA